MGPCRRWLPPPRRPASGHVPEAPRRHGFPGLSESNHGASRGVAALATGNQTHMADSYRSGASVSAPADGASTRTAGLVLGLGIGGFIDGIILHQLLGWHHMLSGWYPGNEHVNMIGDGLFHLGCLVIVVIGVLLLSRARPAPLKEVIGWMIAGWGVFNLVEGLIDHQILGVHHVRHGSGQLLYDMGFLGLGVALIAFGLVLARMPAVGRASRPGAKGEGHE